ncbi:alpha/beta hydrolase [Chitinophaga sp. 212800010-3]|uniref:alpha/beta hydrolase n=1 Tax=unclassified Chitinophaga TaxID=2619133 RepID=UPI002DEFAF76|nr:Endo-1,4-beta-xylanase [Chitinophaga sp. 212800010-3]
MKKKCLTLLICLTAMASYAQQQFPLYPDSIPNATGAPDEEQRRPDKVVDTVVSKVSRPTLTVYQPPAGKANGTAVIICPGGGYHVLCIKMEGEKIAKAFNKMGVTAFVLKYRMPDPHTMRDPSIGPLQDAQQAILTVRSQAARWHVNPARIGIMGFSAGGHLASTAGTHFSHAYINNPAGISLRPDFMVLVYPVVSFSDSIGHIGSRNNLLGATPSPDQVRLFSNELQVTAATPTTFLVHATDDTVVPVENSLQFYGALHRNKIPAAIHIYERGEHGFLGNPPFDEWFGRCLYWMKDKGWLKK